METVTNRRPSCVGARALLVAALLVPGSASADPIAHDGFTPSFPIYANGGTGFAGGLMRTGT